MTTAAAVPRAVPRLLAWAGAHARQIALLAVLLNLAGTLGYSLLLGGELRYLDERDYVALADAMAHGHGYSVLGSGPTAYRPPGYPFLLVPAYLLSGGSVPAMRLVGVFALAGSVWLSYLLGRRAHSEAAGAVAAVLVAAYPLLGYTATALYPQVPALLLLLLFLELTFRALAAGPVRRRGLLATGAGLAAGSLILTVPSFGPSVLVVVGWLIWRHRHSAGPRRVVLGTAALLLVVAAVLPFAWCVRNAVQVNTFGLSTNNGVNLLLGNNPGAAADQGAGADLSAYREHFAGRHPTEVELDGFYRDQAIAWITGHPGDALRLYASKVVHTFSFRDQLATGEQAKPMQDLVSALSFYPVLALAALRLLLVRRRPLSEAEQISLVLVVMNVLLLAVFFTRLRLRMPLDGLIIILAATAVTLLAQRWITRRPAPVERVEPVERVGRAG